MTTRQRHRNLSTRSMAEAWWAPVIAAERERAWTATRERINAAILRTRHYEGYESPRASALGAHLYAADATATQRRSA